MTTAGVKTVTVSYTENSVEKTTSYDITVNAAATLTSITLSGTYPTVFTQGDEFSSEGIVVTANWSDATTSDVTADATFEGYDMSTVGEQTVTVSYGDKTAEYTINVNEYVMPSVLTIDFENALSTYKEWTFFNIGTANTTITARGGSKYGANINDSGNGVATASITTNEKIANPGTLTCYVSKTSTNTKTSTWSIDVSYDGSTWTTVETKDATTMSAGTWEEFTADLSNYKNVYVAISYSGSTAIRAIDDITLTMAAPKVLSSIAVDASGATTVFHVGDAFTHADVVVTATYEDESTKDVTVNATFSTPDMTTAGNKTVTVSYTENEVTKTTTYDITVKDPATLTSITLSGTYPTKFEQGDTFSSEGIVITANWSDNTTSDVTSEATFSGYDMNTLGEQTVTVTYESMTATYQITVVEKKGTADNPYTVAEAIAFINTLGSSTSAEEVYVSGIISQVDSYNSNYSSITYWISDDGTTTDQMEVYSGLDLNGEGFSAVTDLAVGDIVTVKGYVKKYNSTPEFNYNNQLVSWERPANTNPSITVAPATVEVDADEHDGTIKLTYENLTITDMGDFDILFYDAEGEETDKPDWIKVLIAEQDPSIGEGYVVSYVIDANDSEVRNAYFKVYALDDEVNKVYSNLVTVTQAAYVDPSTITTYSLTTSITSGKHYIITNGTDAAMGYDKGNNRDAVDVTINEGVISLAPDAGVYEFVISGPDAHGFYTIYDETPNGAGYLYAASSNANYLKTKEKLDDNGKWSIVFGDSGKATVIAQGDNTRNEMRYNYNNGNDMFSCYASGQKDIYLYEKEDEPTPTETVKVTAAKYATYCSENALDFSDSGLTAYIAKVDDDNKVTFETVTKVPAYTGVLLKANAAGDFTVPSASSKDDVTGNAFIGVTEETDVNETGIYVLLNGDAGVGFYKTKYAFTVGAHTAYLPADVAGARSFIAIDEATAIEDIAAETMTNGEVYNLQGQRVVKAQKGLYIINGKKVVIK